MMKPSSSSQSVRRPKQRRIKPVIQICIPWKWLGALLLLLYIFIVALALGNLPDVAVHPQQFLWEHLHQQHTNRTSDSNSDHAEKGPGVIHHENRAQALSRQQLRNNPPQQQQQQPPEPMNNNDNSNHAIRIKAIHANGRQRQKLALPSTVNNDNIPYQGMSLTLPSEVTASWSPESFVLPQQHTGTVERWYEKHVQELEKTVSQLSRKTLVSCRRDPENSNTISTDPLAHCRPSANAATKTLYFYNILPHNPRILSGGHAIPPKSLINVTTTAIDNEPVLARLFPTIPSIDGAGMPPIITSFNKQDKRPSKPFAQCDIPCNENGAFSIVTTRYIRGTNWKISMSMEGPEYYPMMAVQPDGWKQHKFWSTTSFESEIPLPYYSRAEYDIRNPPPVDYATAVRGGLFMARNCNSQNDREKLVRELQQLAKERRSSIGNNDPSQQYFQVDSVSSCLHNADPPPGSNLRDKESVMKRYLFYFAFENQCVNDYITEKLWGPMQAGTVPVYFGAPNIKDHAPQHSLIHVDDFPNTRALYEYLTKVAHNQTLYESYHAWRHLPQPAFDTKMNLTFTHGTCRTCRWAYARLYGLGWDHPQQAVRDLHIPRRVCVQDSSTTTTGLLTHPVVEQWTDDGASGAVMTAKSKSSNGPVGENGESQACLEGNLAQNEIQVGDKPVFSRIMRQVDGVIDIEVYALDPSTLSISYTLHLATKLGESSSFTALRKGQGRLQDDLSRLTVLTLPTSVAISAQRNTLQLAVDKDSLPLRVRLISEDVDTFHKGAADEENYFGSLMIKDFYYPVEAFYESG